MNRTTAGVLAAALAATAVAALVGAAASARPKEEVVYDRESRYYRIRVVDYPERERRCLHFSKSRGVQSSMQLDDPYALDLDYSKTMIAALALHPESKSVLLVGLGGASIPKFIQKHFPEIRLDVVELDPDVVKVCQEHFHFRGTPNTRVFVMDGRLYLKRSEERYDVILLDAYAADHIPFHLTTMEFLALVRERLNPRGVAASNLWERAVNRFYRAELKTFQETFAQTYRMRAGSSGNIIVFGTVSPERVTKREWIARARELAMDKNLGFDLPGLVAREYDFLQDLRIVEKPLTDDMAPVNTLRHEHPKHFQEEAESR